MKHMFKPYLKRAKPLLANPLGKLFCKIFPKHFNESLTIFVYHDVTDHPSEFSSDFNLWVSPDLFTKQISFIRCNFNIVGPADLTRGDLPPKAALVTFDDGFRSVFKNALPILSRYNIPSIFFLNMGPVRGDLFWGGLITYLCKKDAQFTLFLKDRLPGSSNSATPEFLRCSVSLVEEYLYNKKHVISEVEAYLPDFADENEMEAVSSSSLVFFGNHLYNHYIPALMSNEELMETYLKNEKALYRFPNSIRFFSFPFGQPGSCFKPDQIDVIRRLGAKKIFSSSLYVNHDRTAYVLDRIDLTNQETSDAKIWFRLYQKEIINFDFIRNIGK